MVAGPDAPGPEHVGEPVHAVVGFGEAQPPFAADERLAVGCRVDDRFPQVREVVLHGPGGYRWVRGSRRISTVPSTVRVS